MQYIFISGVSLQLYISSRLNLVVVHGSSIYEKITNRVIEKGIGRYERKGLFSMNVRTQLLVERTEKTAVKTVPRLKTNP